MINYTWMTSPITEVVSKKEDSRFKITEIKTQNSEYEVLIPKK